MTSDGAEPVLEDERRALGPWALKVIVGGLLAGALLAGSFATSEAFPGMPGAFGMFVLLSLGAFAWLKNLVRALQPLLEDEDDDLGPDVVRALIATLPFLLGPAPLMRSVPAEMWGRASQSMPRAVPVGTAAAVTMLGAVFTLALALRRHRPARAEHGVADRRHTSGSA